MSEKNADTEPVRAYNGPPLARKFFGLFGIKISRNDPTEADQ